MRFLSFDLIGSGKKRKGDFEAGSPGEILASGKGEEEKKKGFDGTGSRTCLCRFTASGGTP